jgi:hypothetical protein
MPLPLLEAFPRFCEQVSQEETRATLGSDAAALIARTRDRNANLALRHHVARPAVASSLSPLQPRAADSCSAVLMARGTAPTSLLEADDVAQLS